MRYPKYCLVHRRLYPQHWAVVKGGVASFRDSFYGTVVLAYPKDRFVTVRGTYSPDLYVLYPMGEL